MKPTTYLLLALLLVGSGCKKASEIERQAIGNIRSGIKDSAIANTTFSIISYKDPDLLTKSERDEHNFTTDNDGNFNVTFNASSGASISIGYPGRNPTIDTPIWSDVVYGRDKLINCGIIVVD